MSNFMEFLRDKQSQEEQEAQSLVQRREEWLTSLRTLFDQIETWLAEPTAEKLVKIVKRTIEIDEYKIGRYEVPQLLLYVGHDVVRVEPVGTLIIGAKGRVDLKAASGSRKLVLTDQGGWGLLETDRAIARKLDQEAFIEAIQSLLL